MYNFHTGLTTVGMKEYVKTIENTTRIDSMHHPQTLKTHELTWE